YLQRHGTFIGCRGPITCTNAQCCPTQYPPQWQLPPSRATYANEGDHWDIKVPDNGNTCDSCTQLAVSAIFGQDPNDKEGSVGVGQQRYLSGQQPLRYSIFFENEATATAPAQHVIIRDPLDATHMDLSTLSL